MSKFWWKQSKQDAWRLVTPAVGGEAIFLSADPGRPVALRSDDVRGRAAAYVLQHPRADGSIKWMLFCAGDDPVRLNGEALAMGVYGLADGDDIDVGDVGTLACCARRPTRGMACARV